MIVRGELFEALGLGSFAHQTDVVRLPIHRCRMPVFRVGFRLRGVNHSGPSLALASRGAVGFRNGEVSGKLDASVSGEGQYKNEAIRYHTAETPA